MSQANGPTPRELWEELGSYSTLHGFHFTYGKSSRFRRTLWVILMLGAGSFLGNQIYSNFLKVMAFQVVLKYRTEMKGSLDFPAVSLCNNNMFRKTRINGTFAQRYLDLLDVEKSDHWAELESGMNYSMDMESAARQYGHNLTEMMNDGKCHWPGRTCNERNFTTFFEPKYGLCYTFNSGKNGQEITKSANTGVSRGFTVTLDTQPEEYYGPYSYGGTGFRVIIHDQNEHHPMNEHSLQISPGFNVEMKITRKEYHNLEAPYPTQCKKEEGYSSSKCLQRCFSHVIVTRCGCRVLGSTGHKLQKVAWCTPWQIKTCVSKINLSNNYLISKKNNLRDICNCPVRCHHVVYSVQSSFMAFPSESYWDILTKKYNVSKLDEFEKRFRNRFVRLDVYYRETKIDIASEEPVYTMVDLANDLGGSMGLFLGCSVLTVVEFIDVLILMCISQWKRRRQTEA